MPPPRRSADVPVVHQATVLKNGVGSRGCCGKLVQLTKVGRGGIDHNGSLYDWHFMPMLILLGDGILLGWFPRSKRKLVDVKWCQPL